MIIKKHISYDIENELREILKKNDGIFTTMQANSIGVSNEYLRLLANSGKLDRVSHGVYMAPNEFVDKMYLMQLKRPKIIYSHETALFLHELTDRDPINYTVTVPTGYNSASLRKDGSKVFGIKRELHKIGLTRAKTMFGHDITTYDLERTVCDCIRCRNKMDIAVVTDAIKRYTKRSDKNLNTLMEMAKTFQVTKLLKNYLEVLL